MSSRLFSNGNYTNEPVGSMGNIPHCCGLKSHSACSTISDNYLPRLPILHRPIREGLVIAPTSYIGSVSKNLLIETRHSAAQSNLPASSYKYRPGKIRISDEEFTHVTIPIVFKVSEGGKGLKKAVESICEQV